MSAGDHCTTQTSKNPVQHGIDGVFDALQVPPRGVEQHVNSNQKTNICSIGGATVGAPGDDLEQIVSELRDRLTPDQYQQLVKKLLGNG